ncbi:phage/plasmid primase, P4 family [Blastopirellula retiformator]|uniref:SF3 helicase domain-containing protein n=1 Tax=Blastopirellula retiformator TaxID=2527970 RepID=A0A5C5UXX3_9BACT|nr:phage/plasmid primase, P4 family [Blastopirellula retiformator]TWT30689.1 hypothetical protein Enr8_42120 [Blastopirellula retiformator]
MYDVSLVKSAASGRWSEIFQSLGISADCLTGQHTACPKCGGHDRFRLLDENDGALICNQCFREKNGDGIAAAQWFLGCNFQDAITRIADYLGIAPEAKSTRKKADPEEHLEFLDWNDGLANYWCQFVKPGVTLEGLRRIGAERVRYRNQYICLAIPVYGEKLLAAKPVGWCLYPMSCDKLPVYSKGKGQPTWEKVKLTAGSGRGVVGKFTAENIGQASTIYKVEGVTDLLTILSQDGLATSECPITNASGAGEKWKPWMLELLRDKELVVIHDCDKPGQDGAESLLGMSAAYVASGKNVIPPYPIKPDHGEDLRDWFGSSGNLEVLRRWAAEAKTVDADKIDFDDGTEADDDPFRIARWIVRKKFTVDGVQTLVNWREEWFLWEGKRYRNISRHEFESDLCGWVKEEIDRIYQQNGDREKKKIKVTRNLISNVMAAVRHHAKISEQIEIGSWYDGRRWEKRNLVALENGILDVDKVLAEEDGEFSPHSPHWFSPVCLPYAYNPDATCPTWLAFLQKNLEGDRQRINLLQEWAGYLLTPDTSRQKFLLLEGEGANGKSVYLAGLQAMLGEENVSHVPLELFGERFQLTATLGKLANVAADCGEIDRVAEGHLKTFTSGDVIQFDRKNRDPISALPTARLMVATNNRPRFNDKSDGVWRRMMLVPWLYQVPEHERVNGMDRTQWWKDRGELPGMLAWAILGLRRLRAQNGFTTSQVGSNAIEDYKLESNPARAYLFEVLVADENSDVESDEIYASYKKYCEQNGYKPFGNRIFFKEFNRAFPNTQRVRLSHEGRPWAYRGVRFESQQPNGQYDTGELY